MILETDVVLTGIRPEMIIAIIVIDDIFKKNNEKLTLTSICNYTKEKPYDLHIQGLAIDIKFPRNPNLTLVFIKLIEKALGRSFRVILEDGHIHVDFNQEIESCS